MLADKSDAEAATALLHQWLPSPAAVVTSILRATPASPALSGGVLSQFAKEPASRGQTEVVTLLCSDLLQWVPWESVLEVSCGVVETVRCVSLSVFLDAFKQADGVPDAQSPVGILVVTGRHFGQPSQLKTLDTTDTARLQWHMRRIASVARIAYPFAVPEYSPTVLAELHSQHAPYQNVVVGARDTLASLRAKFSSVIFADVASIEANPSCAGEWLEGVVSKDAAAGDVQFSVVVVLSARELLGFSDATAVWAARSGVTVVFAPHVAMKAVIRVLGDAFADAAKAYSRMMQTRARGESAVLADAQKSPWHVLRGAVARCRAELGVRLVVVNGPR